MLLEEWLSRTSHRYSQACPRSNVAIRKRTIASSQTTKLLEKKAAQCTKTPAAPNTAGE
jgi:hypothetical protein